MDAQTEDEKTDQFTELADRRIHRTLWYLVFYVFNKRKITIFKTKIKLESEKSG